MAHESPLVFDMCDDLLKSIICWLPGRFLEFSPQLILPSERSRYAPSQWPSLQALQFPAEPVDLTRRDADGGSLVSIVQLRKGIQATTRPQQSFMEAPFLPADVYSHTTSGLQAFNTAMRPLVAGQSREQVQVSPSALYQHFRQCSQEPVRKDNYDMHSMVLKNSSDFTVLGFFSS